MALTRCNGYAAECERTFFTAPPDDRSISVFEPMMEARRLGFSFVKPGMSCAELDARVNAFLSAEGYGDEEQRLHRTGHGFGLGNHEAPWIAEGSDQDLEENMVISIEPGIYADGFGGIRHSDTILVTRDGYEVLTISPTDVDSMTMNGMRLVARIKGWRVRSVLRIKEKRAACSVATE